MKALGGFDFTKYMYTLSAITNILNLQSGITLAILTLQPLFCWGYNNIENHIRSMVIFLKITLGLNRFTKIPTSPSDSAGAQNI